MEERRHAFTLGRSSHCDVKVVDRHDRVSRCHLEISYKDGYWSLTNVGLNEVKIVGAVVLNTYPGVERPLQDDDDIWIGKGNSKQIVRLRCHPDRPRVDVKELQ